MRNYRALPKLDFRSLGDFGSLDLPSLSIIIPARNEAGNLARLLPSLHAVQYPGECEILVIDDNSTDGTAEAAGRLGACVHPAGALPAGWLGKPHACQRGAERARGAWLLFTDADTEHMPHSAAAAVGYAVANNLDGLSLLPAQHTFGIADRLALMAAFAGLFAGMRRGQPLINGQYLLIRRDAYFESGGFAAVRAEPLEDLAFAHSLARQGYRLPALHGAHACAVQMYRDTRHLWHGLTRLGAGSLQWAGAGGWLTALFITGALLPVLFAAAGLLGWIAPLWVLFAWALVVPFFIPWARRAGAWGWALLAPLGALLVQAASVWGLARGLMGRGILWKGRLVGVIKRDGLR
jgi:chlorobactene glucosyltransferase